MGLDGLKLLVSGFTLVPRLEGHEKRGVVRGAHETEQTEAEEAGNVLYAWGVQERFFHVGGNCPRAFKRSAVRELHIYVEIALILVRKKARWDAAGKKAARQAKAKQHHDHHNALSN